jgi:hypothetical protein
MAEIVRFPASAPVFARCEPARSPAAPRPRGAFASLLAGLFPRESVLRPEELSDHLRRDLGFDTGRGPRDHGPY